MTLKLHRSPLIIVLIATLYILSLFGILGITEGNNDSNNPYDIVVYGGTSAGVTAAIQSSRMGKSVVVIEPTERIGGLTTGGLGATDIGNKNAIGGISREFYQNLYKYYSDTTNWKSQNRSDYLGTEQRRTEEGEEAMWTFEPSAALKVYTDMINSEEIDVVYNERLDLNNGVQKRDGSIISIKTEDGTVYEGETFIDATYEGDLMAEAGVSYTVGRESNNKYNETLNGVQLYPDGLPEDVDPIKIDYFEREWRNRHQFPNGVDPYIERGNPESGLLWGISQDKLQPLGTGDKKVQAYNFRITLTSDKSNMIPITRPVIYDSTKYELLVRLFEAQPNHRDINDYFIWTRMPNNKTDINNRGAFSTDMIGMNYNYPEASYDERKQIIEDHESYTKGLLYFYKTDPRVPQELQEFVSEWGYPKDEFINNGHFTPQLYIREARRMVGEYVMTQNNVIGKRVAQDSIGMAAYGMDSHHTQRFIRKGMVLNEGDVQVHDFPPYPISYRSLTPKKQEVENLLVPVALSATHIAFGSIRMEPVFMVLGQSAATAAAIAIDDQVPVQEVNYQKLKKHLQEDKQRLDQ